MDYIIYTNEGYSQMPSGEDIENCQILDFRYNEHHTKIECLNQYLKENSTIEFNFNRDEIRLAIIIDDEICHSMKKVVSFLQKKAIEDEEIIVCLDKVVKYFNL